VREWIGYKWHRIWTSFELLWIHECTSLFLIWERSFLLPDPFATPQERICSMDLVTYDDDRYATAGGVHIAGGMCMEVGYVCCLVCSVSVLSYVTVLGTSRFYFRFVLTANSANTYVTIYKNQRRMSVLTFWHIIGLQCTDNRYTWLHVRLKL
jgi:hypothetical protein